MSTYQKPTTMGGKVFEKTILTIVLLGIALFLWAAFLAPPSGCHVGGETTSADCGYDY